MFVFGSCLWALGGDSRCATGDLSRPTSEAVGWPLGAGVKGCDCDVMIRVAVQRDGACLLRVVCGG